MKFLLLSTILLTLIACNGGGSDGGNGNGAEGFTHNQLAEKFVNELNLDADFSVTLTKKSTLQNNFLVIYDPLTDSYDAINIDNYDPASTTVTASDYYYANSSRAFFDLDVIPSHYVTDVRDVYVSDSYYDFSCDCTVDSSYWGTETYQRFVETKYRDRPSGLTFEKITATPKDLAKMSAIKEAHSIQKSAEFLSSEFGLSLNRSKEIASLTNHWKKASKKGMSASETDKFATELLGFSLSRGVSVYKDSLAGDSSSLDSLIEEAAISNDITPEHATGLMTKVFGL